MSRVSARIGLALVATQLCACGLQAPAVGEVLGGQGPTVARALFEVRVRHDELLRVQVVFPSDAGGQPLVAVRPGVVLIQGGGVRADDYLWLAEALARQGRVVAIPEHFANLALFSIDDGRFARKLLAEPPPGSVLSGLVDPSLITVVGHSLGGVVATKLALDGGFGALALLAAYPDSGDDPRLGSLGVPSLSLAGRSDCTAKLAQVEAGAQKLPSPTALAVMEGVTHYQFTNSDQPDRDHGCTPGLDLAVAHARMAQAMNEFLSSAQGPLHNAGAVELARVEGLEVTGR
jgi:pimeloyl-ACP methyl ester carboxylesterase